MHEYLKILANGESLTREQAEGAMHMLMRGEVEPEVAAAFLMGLRSRGETLAELVGFTRIMREYAVPVQADDPNTIDLCGTGGDNTGSFNVSTAAALVCAGAGVSVAKHGNRSVSSKSGSADVLEALGVNVELRPKDVEACLREAGIAFIFAPYFHPALRHVMPVRRLLRVRTFFNILGPLCNPAGVRRQILGAFSTDLARLMAEILAALDAESIVTVHSSDGMDEISVSGETSAFVFERGNSGIHAIRIDPAAHGLSHYPAGALQGGTPTENAEIFRGVMAGRPGPYRDVVLLNAAYGLLTSGKFGGIETCLEAARESIDSGAAAARLQTLITISQDLKGEVA